MDGLNQMVWVEFKDKVSGEVIQEIPISKASLAKYAFEGKLRGLNSNNVMVVEL